MVTGAFPRPEKTGELPRVSEKGRLVARLISGLFCFLGVVVAGAKEVFDGLAELADWCVCLYETVNGPQFPDSINVLGVVVHVGVD